MLTNTQMLDCLLRGEGKFSASSTTFPLRELVVLFLMGGFVYGVALGAFGARPMQMIYSGVKIPLLLIVATMVCLPSFFVLNLVLGLGEDFGPALKGVMSAQSTFAVLLGSLAPLPLVYYQSTADYRLALNFNGIPFLLALLGAQVTLRRHYQPLIRKNSNHKITLWVWLFLFAAVAMQSAWVLRPFVGDPRLVPEFMRHDAWSNAYVEIWDDILKILGLAS